MNWRNTLLFMRVACCSCVQNVVHVCSLLFMCAACCLCVQFVVHLCSLCCSCEQLVVRVSSLLFLWEACSYEQLIVPVSSLFYICSLFIQFKLNTLGSFGAMSHRIYKEPTQNPFRERAIYLTLDTLHMAPQTMQSTLPLKLSKKLTHGLKRQKI